jgi:hypothetical protein
MSHWGWPPLTSGVRAGGIMRLRILSLALLALPAFANDGIYLAMGKLPPEVRPFVAKGTRPLSFAGADLNGDGLQDPGRTAPSMA